MKTRAIKLLCSGLCLLTTLPNAMAEQLLYIHRNSGPEGSDFRAAVTRNGNARHIQERIKNGPDRAEAYCDSGDTKVVSGECEAAVIDYLQALKMKPGLSRALLGRSKAYESLGKLDLALDDAKAATNSKDWTIAAVALFQCTNVLALQKKYRETLPMFDKLMTVKADPTGKHALLRARAMSLMQCGEYGRAAADLSKAVELFPDRGETFALRAECESKLKHFEKALQDLSTAIRLERHDTSRGGTGRLDDQSSVYLNKRAAIYDAVGRHDEAQRDRREAKAEAKGVMDTLYFRSDKP